MGASITIDCYANRVNTLAMDTLQTHWPAQIQRGHRPEFYSGSHCTGASQLLLHRRTYSVYFGMVGLLKKHSELAKSDSLKDYI